MKKTLLIGGLLIAVLGGFDVARSWINPSADSTISAQVASANSSSESKSLVVDSGNQIEGSAVATNPAPTQESVADSRQYTVGFGPLHAYMVNNLAAIFGLDPEAIQRSLDQGKTMWDLAQAEGLSAEQFKAGLIEARANALAEAVADGVITQTQANRMIQNSSQMLDYGNGLGVCAGGGRPNGFNRGRFSTTNTQ